MLISFSTVKSSLKFPWAIYLGQCFKITPPHFDFLHDPLIKNIPATRVFLGADAQLPRTSVEGARMSLNVCLKNYYLN